MTIYSKIQEQLILLRHKSKDLVERTPADAGFNLVAKIFENSRRSFDLGAFDLINGIGAIDNSRAMRDYNDGHFSFERS